MVSVKIEGHDFVYQVEDVIKLFFKDLEINYLEDEPPENQRGVFILSRINPCNDGFSVFTGLWVDGVKNGDVHMMLPIKTVLTKEDHRERKLLKREVKRQIFMVLKKYSGKELPWGILTGIRPAKIVYELLEEGKEKEAVITRLKDYYFLREKKAELIYSVAKAEYELLKKACPDMVSIYIGIPFCPSRCLYCSFTSNPVDKYTHVVGKYVDTLMSEIKYAARVVEEKGWRVQNIYIGGGTPTSMGSEYIEALLTCVENLFNLSFIEEYTLEAGRPDSINIEKLKAIKKSSVNRISINPQTMNDPILEAIGRNHNSEDVLRAFYSAREIGFDNINMDVIVGLPGESPEMFENSLERLGELGPESLTVHTMAVKRASRLKDEIDNYKMISENEAEYMVDIAAQYAASMGMRPYYLYRQKNILGNLENIGYSKPGRESMYNIQIMEERQTIIALGAGAVTKVVYGAEDRIERAFNVKNVEEYLKRVDEMIERKRVLFGC